MRHILILLCLSGCATLRPAHPVVGLKRVSSPAQCSSLATKAEVQHILAIVFGGVGTGGAGVAPAFQSNAVAQDVILGLSGAFGLAGAVLSYTAGVASADYAKFCP